MRLGASSSRPAVLAAVELDIAATEPGGELLALAGRGLVGGALRGEGLESTTRRS